MSELPESIRAFMKGNAIWSYLWGFLDATFIDMTRQDVIKGRLDDMAELRKYKMVVVGLTIPKDWLKHVQKSGSELDMALLNWLAKETQKWEIVPRDLEWIAEARKV